MADAVFLFDRLARWSEPAGASGAEQMALDEVMLRLAGLPTLRIYRWRRPEVTFGYRQPWEDALAFAATRPLTRRCTGGGFVEHGEDVTVALAVPISHPFARLIPTQIYREIHLAIQKALGVSGLHLATSDDCRCGDACFANPAAADVMMGPLKILGGAQRRSREGFLYQGSIQGLPVDAACEERLAAAFSPKVEEWQPPSPWRDLRDELISDRYGSASWNRRR